MIFNKFYTAKKICLIFAILLHLPSHAQNETTLDELLEMNFEDIINYEVVTPTKSGMPLSKIPGSVSVITYKDIQRSAATTIPELLRLVPGMNVRWNPMVQTIDARSFGSNPFTSKILLMIDGVPYNSWNKGGFPQHPGFDFFNLSNVKHIEVIRGAGSALYGENALNGVINIVTFSGEEFESTQTKLSAGASEARELSITAGRRIADDKSIFASFRASRGQLPGEIWRKENAGAEAYDLFVKAKFNDLQMSYYRRQDNFEGFNVPTDNPRFPSGSVFKSAENIRQTVNILAAQFNTQSKDDRWSVQANTSYSNRNGSHCAACHAPTEDTRFHKSEDHGYQFFANSQIGLHYFDNHNIIVGAEYRKISAGDHDHEFHRTEEGIDHAEQHTGSVTSYNKSALFIQDSWQLPTATPWTLIAGLRYDSETSTELFDSDLFPRVALVGSLTPKTTLRFNWSKATRYPSFTELNQSTGFLSVEAPNEVIPLVSFTPNPELKPETIRSFEFGLSYQISNTAQVKIDAYDNTTENSIGIAYPRFRFENHPSDAHIQGVDIEVKSKPNETLSLFANVSYQKNKASNELTDSGENPLEFTYSPEYKINAGVYYTPRDNVSINLEASWRDEYTAPSFWYPIVFDGDAPRPLDDYLYLNARVDYKPKIMFDANRTPLTISLIAKNLSNERPYETLSGLGGRSPGREFFLRFSYDWPM